MGRNFLRRCFSVAVFQRAAVVVGRGVALSAIVCGPGAVAGVTYAQLGGQMVECGLDSAGKALYLQVSTLSDDQPVVGGEIVGMQIGGAILALMAVAFAFRLISNYLNSSGE